MLCRKSSSITSTQLEICSHPSNPTHGAPESSPPQASPGPWRSFNLAFITQHCNCTLTVCTTSLNCSFLGSRPVHPGLPITCPVVIVDSQLTLIVRHCRVKHTSFTHVIPFCTQPTTRLWQVESYHPPERQYRVVAENVGSGGQPGPCHVLHVPNQVPQPSRSSAFRPWKQGS